MSWLSRFTNVFRAGRLDGDLNDELHFHVEARVEELMAKGMPREEAEREVQRHFGNQLLLRESSRDVKLFSWLESVMQDVRFGLRMLRKNAGVTAAAILSLSLAIGACTGAFSLIDALILRPLPVREPPQLVYCSYPGPNPAGAENMYVNEVLYDRLAQASKGKLELLGASIPSGLYEFDDASSNPDSARSQVISGGAFGILGVRPVIGRLFTPDDDGRRIAVLNYSFWSRHFASSPGALGRWFTLEGKQYQIVGVAQKGFDGLSPGYRTDYWIPKLTARSAMDPYSGWDQVWGRLMPGVTREQARQALQVAFTNYRRDHTDEFIRAGGPPDQLAKYKSAPIHLNQGASGSPSMVRMEFERPFWILAVVVLLVLLIACSNVANLLVARAAAREREMAMRISIGAGRARLIEQLLIESGLLAAIACLLGLAIGWSIAPVIVNLLSPSFYPAYLDLHIGWRVLGFVSLMGVATTVLFGLVPALRASAVAPLEALKAGGSKQSGRIGVLRPLLASQVGFSFIVLFVGGLLLLSFDRLNSVDLGFSKNHVALVDLMMSDSEKNDRSYLLASQILDQVRRIPGVEAVSLSIQGLIGGNFAWVSMPEIRFPGREPDAIKPRYLSVSPGFFDTMQIKLLDGRDFDARDMAPGSNAVIVSQEFVRRYLAGKNPLGVRFGMRGDSPQAVEQEIVGVVRDAKFNNLREQQAPTVYGVWRYPGGTMEVRTAGNPLAAASTIRKTVDRYKPAVRVDGIMTQSERINDTLLRERLLAMLAGFFAVVAVLLAAIGLYGVLSYSVVRRTKEIGIRVALGARLAGVVRLVISDVALVIACGLVLGLAGGFALGRFVITLLFEVKPSDFLSLVLPLACFLAASGLAALPPAFRAARVDPVAALREE